ncbi:swr1-complex protein 5 [Acrodontium crateriforme]|uniref:SWR1-complex protein 5 n=1 Tax=Acrodontium crateriforme TaxID=150365 RepID=A0AAQ3RC18_9PEZI|nr:swr1-complex protein 5 [Acrodontium crateriforme]
MPASKEEATSDEEYDENADEDFNPDQAAAEDESSSSEDETAAPKAGKKPAKRKAAPEDELDSGDEATIKERKRKKRKNRDANDSGDDGGLIKTRAQRLVEQAEQSERRRTRIGDVTIDVEEIWNELNSFPIGRPATPPPKPVDEDKSEYEKGKENKASPQQMIKIKRNIEYAGEVTEIEEEVPRNSKEAQIYLKDHPEADPNYKPEDNGQEKLLRPLRRPSMFEPNPAGLVKGVPPDKLRPRAPSRLDVLMAEKRAEEERKKKADKMTTVQKSALDWKGFVEKEGLKDELDTYGKSKDGYLQREEFLGRAQLLREAAGKAARLKG